MRVAKLPLHPCGSRKAPFGLKPEFFHLRNRHYDRAPHPEPGLSMTWKIPRPRMCYGCEGFLCADDPHKKQTCIVSFREKRIWALRRIYRSRGNIVISWLGIRVLEIGSSCRNPYTLKCWEAGVHKRCYADALNQRQKGGMAQGRRLNLQDLGLHGSSLRSWAPWVQHQIQGPGPA